VVRPVDLLAQGSGAVEVVDLVVVLDAGHLPGLKRLARGIADIHVAVAPGRPVTEGVDVDPGLQLRQLAVEPPPQALADGHHARLAGPRRAEEAVDLHADVVGARDAQQVPRHRPRRPEVEAVAERGIVAGVDLAEARLAAEDVHDLVLEEAEAPVGQMKRVGDQVEQTLQGHVEPTVLRRRPVRRGALHMEAPRLGERVEQPEDEGVRHRVDLGRVLRVHLVEEPVFVADDLGQEQPADVDGAAGRGEAVERLLDLEHEGHVAFVEAVDRAKVVVAGLEHGALERRRAHEVERYGQERSFFLGHFDASAQAGRTISPVGLSPSGVLVVP
jgi:hypothetical protein